MVGIGVFAYCDSIHQSSSPTPVVSVDHYVHQMNNNPPLLTDGIPPESTIPEMVSTSTEIISTPAAPITSKTKLKNPPVYNRVPGTTGPLYIFNQAAYEAEVKKGKLVILYYYAKWCPICARETAEALYPFFDSVTDSRVIGFRINFNDFDTDRDETAMAKKYQIAYQHSKVFEYNGKLLLKDGQEWDRAHYDSVFADILTKL